MFPPHHVIELLLLLQGASLDFLAIVPALHWRSRTCICSRIHVRHGRRVMHGLDEPVPLLLKLAVSLRALRDMRFFVMSSITACSTCARCVS